MKKSTYLKKSVLLTTVTFALMSWNVAQAGMVSELTQFDINESALLKNNGVVVGGWLNAGVTHNFEDNAKFNGPVSMGDRSDEFQLNQLNLYIQKAVATEGDSIDIGGRFDIMFGTDPIFTQAYGVPALDVTDGVSPLNRGNWDLNLLGDYQNRFYNLAMPQAYLEAYLPIGNGLNVKAGHFYTPLGYEVFTAPDNFFYSLAYTFQYGEPFTHTGILANYTFNPNWSLMFGTVTGSATGGWDGTWNQQLGNWAGLGNLTWTSTDKNTTFIAGGTYGQVTETSKGMWVMYSMVLKHNFTDKLHWVLQHDHGIAEVLGSDAEWYGVNSHLYYDITDTLKIGIRGEWFRDDDGFRMCTPPRVGAAFDRYNNSYAMGQNTPLGARSSSTCTQGNFHEITVGLNWKPVAWLNVRPNVRYDWSEGTTANVYGDSFYPPLGGGSALNTRKDQFLFSMDFTVTF